MGRWCQGLQLERVKTTQHHVFELFDVGIEPIHGGVLDMLDVVNKLDKNMVIKLDKNMVIKR